LQDPSVGEDDDVGLGPITDEGTVAMTTADARSASSWQVGLALTSLAAGAIHFAVTGDHFQAGIAFGLFFAALAWAQVLWAVGVLMMPTRLLLAAGVAGNPAVVAIWVVSRTTGLPFGPAAGTA
jgi:hypothetical protein